MAQADKRAKILIVDDNKQNIEMLMELFKGEYKIAAAISAERALKITDSDAPPDIILLDILMPGMDGYELCARLKENPKTKEIPVIFVTAMSEIMDENRGFSLGAVDYITKPFHPPMVQARVKLHLNLKRKQELLEEFAFIDALTEIPNRRRFNEVLGKEWYRALRNHRELSLISLDIDHFKAYNDTYGHGRGDDCLRRVAMCIQDCLRRGGDFVARHGGEEFAVVLPGYGYDEAMAVAEHVRQAITELAMEHKASPVAPYVSLSMGVATVRPEKSMPVSDLLESADRQLYAAKADGRNAIKGIRLP